MLNVETALEKLLSNFKNPELVNYVVYKDLLIAQILFGDPNEFGFDPFYSINLNTEEILDFPMLLESSEPVFNMFLNLSEKRRRNGAY